VVNDARGNAGLIECDRQGEQRHARGDCVQHRIQPRMRDA
jgi:hypothetical protein